MLFGLNLVTQDAVVVYVAESWQKPFPGVNYCSEDWRVSGHLSGIPGVSDLKLKDKIRVSHKELVILGIRVWKSPPSVSKRV